ncbi:hypothetical protein HON22_05105 [Candidatus Peregrinibacteria bacterium]|jgi:uncharacterized protein YoxC|nr:hypothetical protein [Candidatus Peregrinibacteria bacterium]
MQLTQIQGANIGQKNIVPQGANVPLPVPPQMQNIQAPGYIHEVEGQKVLVPHANIPVAVNNQPVVSPTNLNHGDAVTINHGQEESLVYAVHKPDEKIEEKHIKDTAKKSGLNLNDAQLQEIVKIIEQKERKSFMAIIAIVILGFVSLAVFIFFLWSNSNENSNTLKQQQIALHSLKSELNEIIEERDSLQDENQVQDLAEKIATIETRLSSFEAPNASLDEEAKNQLEVLINELRSIAEDNKKYSEFNDKLDVFESLLKASDLGIQAEVNTYYQKLKDQCGADECCINSFKVVLENSYKVSENGSCPSGEKLNRLKCIGSYEWCYE